MKTMILTNDIGASENSKICHKSKIMSDINFNKTAASFDKCKPKNQIKEAKVYINFPVKI